MKKTKAEIKSWLLENCIDLDGDLNLSNLDFSDFNGNVYIDNLIVAHDLIQSHQVVGGKLSQWNQRVNGDLIQNNQFVLGDLIQSSQRVNGYIFQCNQQSCKEVYSDLARNK